MSMSGCQQLEVDNTECSSSLKHYIDGLVRSDIVIGKLVRGLVALSTRRMRKRVTSEARDQVLAPWPRRRYLVLEADDWLR